MSDEPRESSGASGEVPPAPPPEIPPGQPPNAPHPPAVAPPPDAPPAPAQYPPGYAYAAAPPAPSTNGMAIASLVLGILWLYWIGSILALIFGYIAKRQIDESGGRQSGRGLAVAGIVLGWIGIGALVLTIIIVIAVVATDSG